MKAETKTSILDLSLVTCSSQINANEKLKKLNKRPRK